MTHGLVGGLVTLALTILISAAPVQEGGVPSGVPEGKCEGRVIDWGSPRLLAEFGSLERLVEWSSPEESSDEGE